MQNAAATAAWSQRIAGGTLPGARGHALSPDDLLRARAIEMLLCDFHLDLRELADRFGDAAATLEPVARHVARRFDGFVASHPAGLTILPAGVPLARIVASAFDAYLAAGGRFSRAS